MRYQKLTYALKLPQQPELYQQLEQLKEIATQAHQRLLEEVWTEDEPVPGIDHFRTPVEKGAELIRDALRGHTTGLAQPMYVIATKIGKIPLMPDYYIVEKNEKEYKLKNYQGIYTTMPNIPE